MFINKIMLRMIEALIFGVVIVYFLTPFWWLFVSSTKELGELFASNPLWFSNISLFNYETAITKTKTLKWLLNSIFVSVSTAFIGTSLSALAGHAFAKYEFKAKDSLFFFIATSMMIPITALALPIFLLFNSIGWLNTYQAVILPSSASAFAVYFMRIFISSSIPNELLDSARIDGASEFRIFLNIVLRNIGPAFLTMFLFLFITTWNNFFLPQLVLPSIEMNLITQGISYYMRTGTLHLDVQYAIILAGSVMSLIPLITLFILLEKYIEKGLTLGYTIKG